MKKIVVATLVSSLLFTIPTIASAAVTPTPKVLAPTPTPPVIEYVLPYPGILPDHPLYFLKQIRDKILDWLIVDPIRKTDFYVLQADKRLAMGIMLFDQGKPVLGEQVVSKGEKYLSGSVATLTSFKMSGHQVPAAVVDRLEKSLAKHKEVIENLLAKVPEAQRSGLLGSLDLAKKLQEDLGKLPGK